MSNVKPRTIIIISLVISVFILLFLVIYANNMEKDLAAINEQINTTEAEYEAILAEINTYDVRVDVKDVREDISGAVHVGETVAKLQTEASEYYRSHVDPMDSQWADTYREIGDKKTISWMEKHFPNATDTQKVMPWSVWHCTWEFSPVFDYQNEHTRLSWSCRDKEDRLLALAYATYDPKNQTLNDLEIIYTKHSLEDSDYTDEEVYGADGSPQEEPTEEQQETDNQTDENHIEQEDNDEE